MKIHNVIFLIIFFILISVLPINAFWLVNPGENSGLKEQVYKVTSTSDTEFGIILETGYRKVHEMDGKELLNYNGQQLDGVISGSNKNIKLKSNRVYFQLNSKYNDYFSFIGRFVVPANIRLVNFEKIPYTPTKYVGLGLGVQFMYPFFIKDLNIGASLFWDFITGFQQNLHVNSNGNNYRSDEIQWREASLVNWISYRYKRFDIYTGYTDKTLNVFLNQGDNYQTNWHLDKSSGWILGTQFALNDVFSLGVESHFVNEYNTAIKINFLF